MSITEDERAVLMIADRGEYMLAIGRWEMPIKDLCRRGLLKSQFLAGGDQYTITEAGRTELNSADAEEDKRLGALIEQGSRIGAAQKTAREHAEDAAQKIAECAKISAPMTGDTPETAARKWTPIILERALDIITHG